MGYFGNFSTKQCVVEMFWQSNFLQQKKFNKACCCGNFPTKWSVVKIFYKGNFFVVCHKGIFWWKLAIKATSCGNCQQGGNSFCWIFLTKQNIFYWNFPWKQRDTWREVHRNSCCFVAKTGRHLEGSLRQNSVNFGENFRKIHQTAKISAQQCCNAARVFVTTPSSLVLFLAQITTKHCGDRFVWWGSWTGICLIQEMHQSFTLSASL